MPGRTYALLPDVFHLTYATNDGVSFGMFGGNMTLIIVITVCMCLAIFVALMFLRGKPFWVRMCGWTALGASLGNLYDRIRFGYVIDLFEIRLFRFAIFNAADMFLCVSIAVIALYILFNKPQEEAA
jgi:signal peptidase II